MVLTSGALLLRVKKLHLYYDLFHTAVIRIPDDEGTKSMELGSKRRWIYISLLLMNSKGCVKHAVI